MSYGSDFTLTLFTRDPELALAADRAGVDRIGVDIERLGKNARQSHLSTWISDHQELDLVPLRKQLVRARLFARCNPLHAGSSAEIDRLLDLGVQVIMLPFFHEAGEAEQFIRLVDGRATPVLLLETAAAASSVADICRVGGVEEIHIGLNDLYLSLGWKSHFEVLVSDLLERLSAAILESGLRLGVGGLGRAGDNSLPVPADLVYAQYPRLGASAALISRVFFRPSTDVLDMGREIARLRANLDHMHAWPRSRIQAAREQLAAL